jgi:hypothetical protein
MEAADARSALTAAETELRAARAAIAKQDIYDMA